MKLYRTYLYLLPLYKMVNSMAPDVSINLQLWNIFSLGASILGGSLFDYDMIRKAYLILFLCLRD